MRKVVYRLQESLFYSDTIFIVIVSFTALFNFIFYLISFTDFTPKRRMFIGERLRVVFLVQVSAIVSLCRQKMKREYNRFILTMEGGR